MTPAQGSAVCDLHIVARAQTFGSIALSSPCCLLWTTMAINKDVRLYRSNTESLGHFGCQVPRQDVSTWIYCKGRGATISRSHTALCRSPLLPLRENLQCCQWQRTPLKAASRRWWLPLVAVFLPLTVRQSMLKRTNAQMAWEEEMSSFQFGCSSESERDQLYGKEAIPATAGRVDLCRL